MSTMSIEIPNTPNPRLKTHTPDESAAHMRLESYQSRSRSNSSDSQEEAQRGADALREAHLEEIRSRAAREAAKVEAASARRQEHERARAARLEEKGAVREAASNKRAKLLESRVEQSALQVKHAMEVVAAAKEKAAESAAALAADIDQRLDAAETRRKKTKRDEIPPTPPSTPMVASAADASAVPPMELEAAGPASEALLAQIRQHKAEPNFEALSAWMTARQTIALVARWLAVVGVEARHAKSVVALVYMGCDAERLFSEDEPQDVVMAKEVRRFNRRLAKLLHAGDDGAAAAPGEKFGATLLRARRFQLAWGEQDKVKTLEYLLNQVMVARTKYAQAVRGGEAPPAAPMETFAQILMLGGEQAEAEARQLYSGETLEQLMQSVLVAKATAARDGNPDAPPPEETLAMIRNLGGEEAEAEARRAYAERKPTFVAQDDFAARVGAIAKRAFWDALRAELAEGKLDGLWSMLDELARAMGALVAASPRRKEELVDRFDVPFLKQQVEHGALDTADVHRLIEYLSATISGWQAPADDADTQQWAEATAAMLRATAEAPLPEFIAAHLPTFLEGALERVAKVFERIHALAEEREQQRQAEAAAAAAGPSETALPWGAAPDAASEQD